jgi:predicted TIM-barrel fold metal-dependent hydrolase
MSDRLTIVSLDGHAQPPPDVWPKYLAKKYHEHLPAINEENRLFQTIMKHFTDRTHDASNLEVFDLDRAIRNGGFKGLWDRDIRIAEMDREGIAAEFIHSGDNRACGLFFQSSNTDYPQELCQAGVWAYLNWLHDTFGNDPDRLYLIGILGSAPWRDIGEWVAAVDWIANRGFKATTLPGFVTYPGQPPLFDKYWDPFWARVQERGLALWMHAGQGERQGELGAIFHRIRKQVEAAGGDADSVAQTLGAEFAKGKVFASIKPRRAMWQLMMGGVFDRFPKLRLVLSEIYGDWMKDTVGYMDAEYEKHRKDLPAKRKPSEYWRTNGINGLSFIRKCEVEKRHDMGIETVAFGRDYPHQEGTWPNTSLWLRDAFDGVPENEVRAILAENVIRVLDLDKKTLDAWAAKTGMPADLVLNGPKPSPELLAHFHKRGQYLEPPEGDTRMPEIHAVVEEDLWRAKAVA